MIGERLTCLLYDQSPLTPVGDIHSNLLIVSYTTDLKIVLREVVNL